jgi:uncharacterized protein YraI
MFPAAVLAEPASVTTSVNMRTGPGIGYSVIQVLPARAQVDARCEPGRTWCQVTYGASAGWISAAYLDDVAAAPPQAPTPVPIATIPANHSADVTTSVNMRTGPGVGYSTMRTLTAGTRVNVTRCAQGSNWCEVSFGGSTGWVSSTYLRNVGAAPQPAPIPIATTPANFAADVTTNVNMRTGPGTGYSTAGTLYTGTRVNVTRCAQGGSWCEVSYLGRTGWVSSAYLDDVAAAPRPTPMPTTPAVFTADVTTTVNMRAGAGVGYSVLRSLPAGTRVNVNSCTQDGSWCQVNYAGSNGWVASRYLVDVAAGGQVVTRPTVGDAVRQGIGVILDELQRR